MHCCCTHLKAESGEDPTNVPVNVVDKHEEDARNEHAPEHLALCRLEGGKLLCRQVCHVLVRGRALHREGGFLHG